MRESLAQTSILRKLLCYRETWRQGLHKTHLGIPNFRVLTVTTTRERVGHLVAARRSLSGGQRLFLFAHPETLCQGDALRNHWTSGNGETARVMD
jgi:hypothetical protein